MVRRILVPLDGSPLSRQALDTALTEYPDCEVVALHVIDPTAPGYSYYLDEQDLSREPLHGSKEWYERAETVTESLFEEALETAHRHERDLTTVTAVGSPEREIVDFVLRNDIDHVIIGSHGRGADSHILLGSVTESVAFRCPVRVTLVR